ncbi:HNH endonuclease family protein [Nostoc sp. FACHB-133]|nr:HNH endonuclease family protein [Nostoc sp. FACHB-133]MBD2524666.1 HNH endonuclease [Nostoc sp. FACHB-133]
MSLEHIMPQKSPLRKEWQEMLGTNYSKTQKELLHTLGNLTLTQYNSELSNKSFEEKLKILRTSNVTLNQYFHKVNVWNEEEIKSRAESLAKIAIKVWPR